MDAPLISIIIPVYNAEATIKKCLESIINQSFNNWEAIIVIDGGQDASEDICEDYSRRDNRFLVIHQNNSGVSAARQKGLEAVHGQYVIHVDADDWIEQTMLQDLYEKASDDNADIVICDFYIDSAGTCLYSSQRPSSLDPNVVLQDLFGTIHGSCCNKLVKKKCIDSCGALFPVGIDYCEDVCFNVQLLKQADIIVSYLNKAYYHYVQFNTSITNNYNINTFYSQKRFVDYLATLLPEDSFPVIKSKELVKKLAFKNHILDQDALYHLYPEIRDTHETSVLMRVMYKCAFNGHYVIASIFRGLYKSVQKLIRS